MTAFASLSLFRANAWTMSGYYLTTRSRAAPCARCSAAGRLGGKCARTGLQLEEWRSWQTECCYQRSLGKSVAEDGTRADKGEAAGGRLVRRECGSRFVRVSCDQSTFSQFKVSKLGSQQAEALWIQSPALCMWEEQRMAKRGRNAPQMNKRLHVFETPTTQLGPIVQCCNFWRELSEVALSSAKRRTAAAGRLSGMMNCRVACLVAVHSQIV